MPNDDHKHSGHFDASMPLPDELKVQHTPSQSNPPPTDDKADDKDENPAADLIRQKVDNAFFNAPPAATEVEEVSRLGSSRQSKHQKFIDELINSGKSLPEIQEAWHEYYAGLPDKEKHAVWQEFYAEHDKNSHAAKETKQTETYISHSQRRQKTDHLRRKPSPSRKARSAAAAPLRSLAFGLGIGCLVVIIFLFSFFNERFIAPFIQPSRTVANSQIINDTSTVSANPEIIIPKINVQIPVVYTVSTIDDTAVENALEGGVVHYADTALPGQDGNLVIVGHSSNNIFNQGKYKFAFVLLSRLENGDTFYLDKNGVRYTYQVYKKTIVSPTDISVLGSQGKTATATLITCDPPGTSTNRLVVVGEQISPSITANTASTTNNQLATKAAIIPGNSPTLWSRITAWFTN